MKRSVGEQIFDNLNVLAMLLLCFIMLYPFWYILILSFNEGNDAARGPIWFWPRAFTLDNYIYVFNYASLRRAFAVTILRCVVGSIFSVTVCMLAAYAFSKRFIPFRKPLLVFFMIPMFIGGTLISNYVVMVTLGLLNSFFVYILPGGFAFFSMVIMRTFIEGLPSELEESAFMEGARYPQIFGRIVVPLSKPVIAAFLFFGVVGHWLDFYTNLIYVTDRALYVVQYILYLVIHSNEAQQMQSMVNSEEAVRRMLEREMNSQGLPTPQVVKMTVMVVVTAPLLFIYPFFQKYFVKGLLVGSIKA